VKKVATSDFANARTRGIIAINLDEGDQLVSACKTNGSNEVVLITRQGQALRMAESSVRVMGRASRGVRGIMLTDQDELCAMLRVAPDEQMLLISDQGYGKRTDYDNFSGHGRGTKGQKIYDPNSGELVCAISIRERDDIVVMTSLGKTLKFEAANVRLCGKTAKGVRIVNIDPPDTVVGIDRIVNEEEETVVVPEQHPGAPIEVGTDASEVVMEDQADVVDTAPAADGDQAGDNE
jgi:DNA gyrase subunit A